MSFSSNVSFLGSSPAGLSKTVMLLLPPSQFCTHALALFWVYFFSHGIGTGIYWMLSFVQ